MNSPLRTRHAFCLLLCLLALVLCGSEVEGAVNTPNSKIEKTAAAPIPQGPAVVLAKNGSTDFQIVLPSSPTPVDRYAADKLALFLKLITGDEFPIVESEKMVPGRHAIFVGISAPVLKALGEKPTADLADQEHISRTAAGNIYLYGKGIHGNLYAVVDFLENSLGWRWYSWSEDPVFPQNPNLTLKPFARRSNFSFPYRCMSILRNRDFAYLHGINIDFDYQIKSNALQRGETPPARSERAFVSILPEPSTQSAAWGFHSLFSFIPPNPDAQGAKSLPFLENRNYFATNPDFFSMDENGKRVPNRQLEFGNPELRRELTKNILRYIESQGGDVVVQVGAMDQPGKFSYSPESLALEEKYQTPAGPLIDYLLELCPIVKEKFPKAMIRTMAYRRSQTQKPPVLPPGKKLPDNLIVVFPNIEDNYFADWTHPDPSIQETYTDLKGWGKISDNLWAWMYPNPFLTGSVLPVGNIERVVTNMRLMHAAGVKGLGLDHNGYHERAGFSELQAYLIIKLLEDIHRDPEPVIIEFTNDFYGPAAPLMRKYLHELEEDRKAIRKLQPHVNYKSDDFTDETFPYLTPENINRWNGYFEQMEKLLADRPEQERINLALARRELDIAILWKWFALQKAHPETYKDYRVVLERLKDINTRKAVPPADWNTMSHNRDWNNYNPFDAVASDFANIIRAGGKQSPVPEQFRKIDPSKIKTFLPTRYDAMKKDADHLVLDPAAAMGYAIPVDKPEYPFSYGFYSEDTKHDQNHKLDTEQITAGKYALYEVGEVEVTPKSNVHFGKSWLTYLKVGERLFEPGAGNRWQVWVSMKFDGPSYGGHAEKDQVLVDRIIFVKTSEDQFAAPNTTPAPTP